MPEYQEQFDFDLDVHGLPDAKKLEVLLRDQGIIVNKVTKIFTNFNKATKQTETTIRHLNKSGEELTSVFAHTDKGWASLRTNISKVTDALEFENQTLKKSKDGWIDLTRVQKRYLRQKKVLESKAIRTEPRIQTGTQVRQEVEQSKYEREKLNRHIADVEREYAQKVTGISEENIAEELEGSKILIYRQVPKKLSSARKKCLWCYEPTPDLLKHVALHDKTKADIQAVDFQKALYQELLRIVRDTRYYMALMFLNAGCQMCDDPVMKGREGCCSIPTSFRDRARSLLHMGVTANGLDPYLQSKRYGQIILAPKTITKRLTK